MALPPAAPATVPSSTPFPPGPPDARRARRRLWLSLGLAIVAITIGALWDGAWHANNPFDSFWSPPHLFIYTMATLSALTAATLGFDPRLRACFGPGFRVPLLKFEVPGALAILAGGFAIIGLAGLSIGLVAFATWGSKGPMPGLALALVSVAPLIAIVGSRIGKGIIAVVKEPREVPVKMMVPILGIGVPLTTGLIDLYLRTVTP